MYQNQEHATRYYIFILKIRYWLNMNSVQDKFQNYIFICFNPFTIHEAEKRED